MESNTVTAAQNPKSKAREQAFIVVFEKCFRDDDVTQIIEDAYENLDFIEHKLTHELPALVFEHLEEIDGLIESNLRGWTKGRISKVSLSIMRVAVCEMLYCEKVPTAVSINEAVELAKKYAGDGDPAYINGVLGSVAQSLPGEE